MSDPHASGQHLAQVAAAAPIVGRMRDAREAMRETVMQVFPTAPSSPVDRAAYLTSLDEIYGSDAYHSLSIEGYRVTPELIEGVRARGWNPPYTEADRGDPDALAVRGYWQAFQRVKYAVAAIIGGGNAGTIVRTAHPEWYRELFQPHASADAIDTLPGYRNHFVFLRTSRYVPPRWETVRDAMPALFDLLENEPEVSVRAVLGRWLFGYIHPYMDGNGRLARFLMNAMLASGGYPWTVVRVEDRRRYLEALERASIDMNIRPFGGLLAERVEWAQAPAG